MYSLTNSTPTILHCSTSDNYIPLDPDNSDYQECLDAIILEGSDCFTGDIPTELQTAANAKQFAQQLRAYKIAVVRLAQYVVSVGRTETESQSAIDAVAATVTRLVYSTDFMSEAEPTEETIENPLITTDVAERTAAQAVVDATPQPVKNAA